MRKDGDALWMKMAEEYRGTNTVRRSRKRSKALWGVRPRSLSQDVNHMICNPKMDSLDVIWALYIRHENIARAKVHD
jgi:hypothetical protein